MARRGRKTSRPLEDRLKELKDRADRMIQNEARAKAESLPQLAKLNQLLKDYQQDSITISRKTTGKNSFENRRESNRLRGLWIDAEERVTTAQAKNLETARNYVNEQVQKFANMIQKGETVSNEMVDNASKNIPGEDYSILVEEATKAEFTWRTFVKENTSSAVKSDELADTAGAIAQAV